MPKVVTPKLLIRTINETGFCLQSVVADPRQCTPLDLQVACDNLSIDSGEYAPPPIVTGLTYYLLTAFFAQAHRSGLYNRQRKVWEALARVTEVKVLRLTSGLFAKKELPIYDLIFQDVTGKILIMARVLEPEIVVKDDKAAKDLLQSAIHRSEKIRSEQSSFVGLFVVWPKPLPPAIKKTVENLTGAQDPILRYESVLPGPFGVCIDLVELEESSFNLVHPQLSARQKGGPPIAPQSA